MPTITDHVAELLRALPPAAFMVLAAVAVGLLLSLVLTGC